MPGPMTRIINLRQARKSRARDAKRAEGSANAARFGEAKPLRDARAAEADRAARVLDAHRAEPAPEGDPEASPAAPAPEGSPGGSR